MSISDEDNFEADQQKRLADYEAVLEQMVDVAVSAITKNPTAWEYLQYAVDAGDVHSCVMSDLIRVLKKELRAENPDGRFLEKADLH